jgi:N-acylneuraminate cytidylyltransferase
VLDFDGVLTDDRVLVGEDGSEYVTCSRSDGMGIARLRASDVPVVILSSETNPVVAARAKKLGVPVEQGVHDKAAALDRIAERYDVSLIDIAYVGNDVNDVDCLRMVGLAAVPADAQPSARACAHYVLKGLGGRGAVRELCDAILAAQHSVPEGWR